MVGERFDIEKHRTRDMSRAILLRNVAVFLSWRRHAGVDNLNLRIVNMLGKPVGGDKKGGSHGDLHVYQVSGKLSGLCRQGTSKRG